MAILVEQVAKTDFGQTISKFSFDSNLIRITVSEMHFLAVPVHFQRGCLRKILLLWGFFFIYFSFSLYISYVCVNVI